MKEEKNRKPKLTKEEKRLLRYEKGREWLLRDNNWKKKHLLSRYRRHMCLDLNTAAKDLEELGVLYNGGDEKKFRDRQSEFQYAVFEKEYTGIVEYSDDTFAFIADYTSGGAPFGATWEDVGIDPSLSYREKVIRYAESMERETETLKRNGNELPF